MGTGRGFSRNLSSAFPAGDKSHLVFLQRSTSILRKGRSRSFVVQWKFLARDVERQSRGLPEDHPHRQKDGDNDHQADPTEEDRLISTRRAECTARRQPLSEAQPRSVLRAAVLIAPAAFRVGRLVANMASRRQGRDCQELRILAGDLGRPAMRTGSSLKDWLATLLADRQWQDAPLQYEDRPRNSVIRALRGRGTTQLVAPVANSINATQPPTIVIRTLHTPPKSPEIG